MPKILYPVKNKPDKVSQGEWNDFIGWVRVGAR